MRCKPIAALLLATCALAGRGIATESTPSQWQLESKDAPSSTALTLTLQAQSEVKGWMRSGRPLLTIQCSAGTAAAYVETGVALEVTQVDQQVVRVRIDDSEFHSERWREVGNWTISSRHANRLIEQLLRARSFTLEFAPFNSPPTHAVFAVRGLEQYAEPLATSCGVRGPAKNVSPQSAG